MRYAGILENDIVNGQDVCVSFWTQGCPHRCVGCHNQKTWDFNGGHEDSVENIINNICAAITRNGIQRNLSILGGEPLCKENVEDVFRIIASVKSKFPDIKVYLWTGYTQEELKRMLDALDVLRHVNMYVSGRFDITLRDVSLPFMGSSNQEIVYVN